MKDMKDWIEPTNKLIKKWRIRYETSFMIECFRERKPTQLANTWSKVTDKHGVSNGSYTIACCGLFNKQILNYQKETRLFFLQGKEGQKMNIIDQAIAETIQIIQEHTNERVEWVIENGCDAFEVLAGYSQNPEIQSWITKDGAGPGYQQFIKQWNRQRIR